MESTTILFKWNSCASKTRIGIMKGTHLVIRIKKKYITSIVVPYALSFLSAQ